MTYTRNNDQIRTAFPASMRDNVDAVLKHNAKLLVWNTPIIISVMGENFTMPHRVHGKASGLNNFSLEQQALYWCIFSRSTDGYTRETAVKQLLLLSETEWTTPYLFVSLSDYVIEVPQIVAMQHENRHALTDFTEENPKLYDQTLARCISYWNEYYRDSYPKLKDYPPYRFVEALPRYK